MKKISTVCLLLAAGSGERSGLLYNKVLHQFGTCSSVEHCLAALQQAGIDNVLIMAAKKDVPFIEKISAPYSAKVAIGGQTRTQSVQLGLKELVQSSDDAQIIVIHDAARPFADSDLFERCVQSAAKHGSGVAAIPCQSTIYDAQQNQYPTRAHLHEIQTPQAFDFELLKRAYYNIKEEHTDDSSVFAASGNAVCLVQGSPANIKITSPNHIFGAITSDFSIGIGYDVHELGISRPLILGGVRIPYHLGLCGHSDADVLTHAIMDAALSAAGLKDIGTQFSPNDPAYKDISSLVLLERVQQMLLQAGKAIHSLSAVVICQAPRLAPHLDNMRSMIANRLKICPSQISLSATTTEGLGIVGEGKGIAASAVALACKSH